MGADQQQEALALINGIVQGRGVDLDFEEWSRQIDAFPAQLRAKYGDDFQANAVELIDQIR